MSSQWGRQRTKPQHHNPYQVSPWYTKKRWALPLAGFVVLVVIAACDGGSENPSTSGIRAAETTAQSDPVATTPSTIDAEPTPSAEAPTAVVVTEVAVVKPKPKPKVVAKPKPAATKPKPKPTKTKKPTSTCDPNYSGGCVPIASDVDCAGGSGNGPAYFSGTAEVVGTDIYKLDADKDGIACEKN
jgi:hypothetical protein